ncbi:NAD(P) transhydrogenase subunit alpha [Rhizobium sp. BK313]|uniref:NAD(P) transhydrogenase subunit alpha n=1 Tax=Rhizobium sp. BK313 TaxID=2587081 RepID=UPI0010CE7F0B|nr:NAD(P) transhydrogenase subunit alpha [Rhizobium sp. BK313]MBB3458290.1 NAD(P) transhydrogenase subunit alpha [Rhizobium sp. BK313]
MTSKPFRPGMVGLLRETAPRERRVALTPSDVKRLMGRMNICVEESAGTAAGFVDQAYAEAGAQLSGRAEILSTCDILLSVQPPEVIEELPRRSTLISLGGRDADLNRRLRERDITHLGLERLPRTSRAQAMDVLSSQATIAGYAAVMEGARVLDILLPMLTTAAGVIKPARMIALGGGVAGLQAIATARRLGAITHGFDVREAAREQIESLGAKFVFPEIALESTEGFGGYAREQSDDQQLRLRRALAAELTTMDLIITSAQIPGRAAPLLIDKETVVGLRKGSVIVDLAVESGGNCALTKANDIVDVGGVHILGPTNLSSLFATDASRLFSGNIRALLEYLLDKEDRFRLDASDPITRALLAEQVAPNTSTPTIGAEA